MQDMVRKLSRVWSHRVGYSGGEMANATHRNKRPKKRPKKRAMERIDNTVDCIC